VDHTHEHDAWVIALRRKTQVVEAIGNELQAPEVDDLTLGEFNIGQVVVVSDNGGFWQMNHRNVQRKARHKLPFLARQLSMFYVPANNRVYKITWF
jgi:hypothetical protein